MTKLSPGTRATVMGLGRFGGGRGAASYLLEKGLDVVVTDLHRESELEAELERLRTAPGSERLSFHLGGHEQIDFSDTDLVIASPAIPHPWSNPFLETAHAHDVPIKTEIELGLSRIPPRKVIGVTGSAGKSTTCAMIAHLLQAASCRCMLGGNIGGSLLDHTQEELDATNAVVIELSSFMLHWLGLHPGAFAPSVGVLTTLGPNHLDWHETLEHYIQSKRVLHDAVAEDRFVHPVGGVETIDPEVGATSEDPWWEPCNAEDPFASTQVQEDVLSSLTLTLPGAHQRRNALSALRACTLFLEPRPGARPELAMELAPALGSFSGLPHRLRPIGRMGGVLVVDDSKSTTPSATVRAVQSFSDPKRVHLVAGGFDKGADLSAIRALGDHVAGLYAIGATATDIASGRNARECGTIDEAVRTASSCMQDGDVLLLSPGCASWDQFDNYEHRGEVFLAAAERCLG